MSKLDELIEKMCPKGIEKVTLKSFCDISTGKGVTNKETVDDGEYPVISGGIEPMGYYNQFNRNENTVTIARAGSAGYVNFIKTKFYLNDKCFSVIPVKKEILPKYLYYSLKNLEVYIMSLKSTGSVPTVNTQKIGNIEIALPPLEVQSEIVRILDNFTELIAELTAELTARNKQFEYYRTQLLTFSDEVEMVTLEDVCQIVDCPHTSPKWKESGVPVIRNYNLVNGLIDTSNLSYVDEAEYLTRIKRIEPQEDDILFSREAPIGNVGIIPANFKCCQGQRVVLLRPDQDIIYPRYLMHILQGEIVRNQISSVEGKGATVSNFNISDLRKLKFQVPDKKTQLYIIDKLDVFAKLNGDIKEGLPAEIKLRKMQYEYYREKLLCFPERSQM